MKKIKDIDLLVVSCDKYEDVWNPFFTSFFKYWPDCSLQVHLISNFNKYDHKKIHSLTIGEDISWSDNLLTALKVIDSKYVLLFCEDLMFNKDINNNNMVKIFTWLLKHEPNYVRLNISHKPKYFDSLMGKIEKRVAYKTSMLPCIWKKSTLQKLLKPGESAWDFEIIGSLRAYNFDEFYSVYKDSFPLDNGVIKGKWRKSVVKKLLAQGLNIDISSRKVMTNNDELIYLLRKIRSRVFNHLPSRLRGRIKEFYV